MIKMQCHFIPYVISTSLDRHYINPFFAKKTKDFFQAISIHPFDHFLSHITTTDDALPNATKMYNNAQPMLLPANVMT